MLYPVAQSYQFSFECARKSLFDPISPDLIAKIFRIDSSSQTALLTRLKITTIYVATAIIFAIPIIQSIALNILLNAVKEQVKDQIKKDLRVNRESVDSLTDQFLIENPQVYSNEAQLYEDIKTFLNLEMKIDKDKISLTIENLLDKEFKEIYQCISSKHPKLSSEHLKPAIQDLYLKALIKKASTSFPNGLHAQCQEKLQRVHSEIFIFTQIEIKKAITVFFKKQAILLKDCIEDELYGSDCRTFSYPPFFIYFTKEEYSEFQKEFHTQYGIFFDWVKKNNNLSIEALRELDDLPQFPFTPFFLSHLSSIHENALLYAACESNHPYLLENGFFSLLLQEFKDHSLIEKVSITERINDFLKNPKVHSRALFYKTYKTSYKATFNKRDFETLYNKWGKKDSSDIQQFLKQEEQEEINGLVEFLWSSKERIEKLKIEPQRLLSEARIERLAKEVTFEYKLIQNHLKRNQNCTFEKAYNALNSLLKHVSRDMFRLFFSQTRRIELEINSKVEEVKNQSPLTHRLTEFQKYREKFLDKNYSETQMLPLTEAINRALCFHLIIFENLSTKSSFDLLGRSLEVLSIHSAVRSWMDDPQNSLQDLLAKNSFKILSQKERSDLICLSFVSFLVKRKINEQFKVLFDSFKPRKPEKEFLKPYVKTLLKPADMDFILNELQGKLPAFLPGIFYEEETVKKDMQAFYSRIISAVNLQS